MYVLLKKVNIRLPMHMHSSTASSEAKQKAHHDGKDSSRENLELFMKRLTGRTSLASLILQQLPLQNKSAQQQNTEFAQTE